MSKANRIYDRVGRAQHAGHGHGRRGRGLAQPSTAGRTPQLIPPAKERAVLISLRQKGDAVKRVLLLMAVLLGGAIGFLYLLPAERRENLSRLPGTMMGWMVEHMPDE